MLPTRKEVSKNPVFVTFYELFKSGGNTLPKTHGSDIIHPYE